MSEPWVPEPAPEEDSNWEPHPFVCPICGVILQRLRPNGEWGWSGWCPRHGVVGAAS